jgi:aminoglycoside N3'-acetyltransferase
LKGRDAKEAIEEEEVIVNSEIGNETIRSLSLREVEIQLRAEMRGEKL